MSALPVISTPPLSYIRRHHDRNVFVKPLEVVAVEVFAEGRKRRARLRPELKDLSRGRGREPMCRLHDRVHDALRDLLIFLDEALRAQKCAVRSQLWLTR